MQIHVICRQVECLSCPCAYVCSAAAVYKRMSTIKPWGWLFVRDVVCIVRQDGQLVTFAEVIGMTELNDGKPRRIRNCKVCMQLV